MTTECSMDMTETKKSRGNDLPFEFYLTKDVCTYILRFLSMKDIATVAQLNSFWFECTKVTKQRRNTPYHL